MGKIDTIVTQLKEADACFSVIVDTLKATELDLKDLLDYLEEKSIDYDLEDTLYSISSKVIHQISIT